MKTFYNDSFIHPADFPAVTNHRMNLRFTHSLSSLSQWTVSLSADVLISHWCGCVWWWKRFLSGWVVSVWEMRSSMSHGGGPVMSSPNQASSVWDCILHTVTSTKLQTAQTLQSWIHITCTVYSDNLNWNVLSSHAQQQKRSIERCFRSSFHVFEQMYVIKQAVYCR